ncbi:hypothetical protein JOC55_005518 [Paenibacillus sacheonensis]|nr:hypothetical protein [Paenibacillus sacheonensis]
MQVERPMETFTIRCCMYLAKFAPDGLQALILQQLFEAS